MKRAFWLRPKLMASLMVVTASTVTLASDQWPSWRGPSQNSHSEATGLIDEFNPKGGPESGVLWKSEEASGISTPIVMNGRLMTIVRHMPGTPKDAEKIVALNAQTGELLWENVYNVYLTDLPAERVGWANLCGDPASDRVYALGACCLFQCVNAETGQTVWSRSLSEEFGMLSTYGGRTNTPVVFENLVIISGVTTGWDTTARPTHRFLAFDKQDGRLAWMADTRPLPEDTTYSTPVIARIDNQMVLVAGSGDGRCYGIQPRTGKVLWSHAISRRGVNTSPSVDPEGTVYIGHGEENPEGTAMGAVVAIDAIAASQGSESAERWRTLEIMNGKSSPLLVEDPVLGRRLYVVEDSSKLHVLDATNGQEIGRPLKLGTAMRGTPLYADGKIYVATSTGYVHILQPTEDGVQTLFKTRLPSGTEVGGSMVAAGGMLYLPTTKGLYCLGTQAPVSSLGKTAGVNDPSGAQPPQENEVALFQVVPFEAIVSPGEQVELEVRAFNRFGELLETPSDLSFQVDGQATIRQDGRLEVAADAGHSALSVVVSNGEINASARYRVVPPLPWSFDFADQKVPITWIGARYRHESRVVDGEPMIVKISTIPKGTRSQSWMGPTDLKGYTIEADFKAEDGADKLPDMGLIAQRYVLDLMGESQQLQIRTWAAQLRMAQSVPFQWQAGKWYRIKFESTVSDAGEVELRGKAWLRDAPEPDDWIVTATDPSPNLQGSPGLFGNATNAEVFIDNVRVQ